MSHIWKNVYPGWRTNVGLRCRAAECIEFENKQSWKPTEMWGKKTPSQKRGVDGEEAWNIPLCYQNNITCITGKRGVFVLLSLFLPWPLLLLPSLLRSSCINRRDHCIFICEGVVQTRARCLPSCAQTVVTTGFYWPLPKISRYTGHAFEVFYTSKHALKPHVCANRPNLNLGTVTVLFCESTEIQANAVLDTWLWERLAPPNNYSKNWKLLQGYNTTTNSCSTLCMRNTRKAQINAYDRRGLSFTAIRLNSEPSDAAPPGFAFTRQTCKLKLQREERSLCGQTAVKPLLLHLCWCLTMISFYRPSFDATHSLNVL